MRNLLFTCLLGASGAAFASAGEEPRIARLLIDGAEITSREDIGFVLAILRRTACRMDGRDTIYALINGGGGVIDLIRVRHGHAEYRRTLWRQLTYQFDFSVAVVIQRRPGESAMVELGDCVYSTAVN